MTKEEELYYETLFLEYKEQLINIIKSYNIKYMKIINRENRPLIADRPIQNCQQNIINIWENITGTTIFIDNESDETLFTIQCIKEKPKDKNIIDIVYLIFCRVFKKLVDEGVN